MSNGSVGDLARADHGSRVLRSDDGSTAQSGSDGRVAGRVPLISRQPRINPLHLDSGLIICSECVGDPSQYLIDFEEVCPSCAGTGFHDDPDFIDGDATEFDPRTEYGTYRVIRGRVA